VLRKKKVYLLSREERRKMCEFIKKTIEEGVYQTLEVTSNNTSAFCRKEG